MQTHFVLFMIALLSIGQLTAQTVRVPARLQIEMARRPMDFKANITPEKTLRPADYLFLGIEMKEHLDLRKIEELGGHINTRLKGWATVHLPKSALVALTRLAGLQAIHYDPSPAPLNERAIEQVQADKVHAGLAPLPQGYSGKDVVVGIIDTGIDYTHEDFRDPTDPSRSRIAYIWDQWIEEGTQPDDFSYGVEWTQAQIEEVLTTSSTDNFIHLDTFPQGAGHGTHVSGTAAGNEGVAYEADIIVVATIFQEANIIDAANYIIQRATEIGKPCVINLSLGSNLHAHDGTDFLSESLSQLLDGTEGKVIVASAGNEGHRLSHWGDFPLSEDSSAVYYAGGNGVEAYFRIPKSVLSTLELDIAIDTARYASGRVHPIAEIGRTGWLKLADLGEQLFYQPFYHNNDSLAVDLFVVNFTEEEKDYAEIYIWLDEGFNLYNWSNHKDKLEFFRFYVRGSGSFDAWFSSVKLYTYSTAEEVGLTDSRYRSAKTDRNIYSPCDGRNILCVGAYTNRPEWIDFENRRWDWPPEQAAGDLANFSSTGPTMDNRIKPEIVAPGKVVASAVPVYNNYGIYLTESAPPRAVFSGTSMSAPIVSGTIALLLQANPILTHEEIKNLITNTAIEDGQSLAAGALPNGYWGYGKLNAYEAMLSVLGVTETEDPLTKRDLFSIFPNPARQNINLLFTTNEISSGEIHVRDLNGRVVLSRQWLNEHSATQIDVSTLPRGMYLLEWTNDNQRMVEKLILQ